MADRDTVADDPLAERVVGSQLLYRGRYLEFRIDTVERADGSRHERDLAVHPGAVAIVALDPDGSVLLVRQYRIATGGSLLEIPAGTLERSPDGTIEDPARAAARELEEETGQRARSWRKLGEFWTAPGFATELMHLYLATDLVPAGLDRLVPETDENLRLERMTLDEALAAIDRGDIADAKTIVGLFWLTRLRGGSAV